MASAYNRVGTCAGCGKSIGCYPGQSVSYYKTNGKLYHGGCSAQEYKCEICGAVVQYTASMKYSTMSDVGHVCKKCTDNMKSAVDTYNKWNNKCVCDKKKQMNCAHHLHDAMIRAGVIGRYSKQSYVVCDRQRLLRAKTMRRVFSSKYNKYTKKPKNGWFYCYQQQGDQGHVCVVHFKNYRIEHHTSQYYANWSTQEYYI